MVTPTPGERARDDQRRRVRRYAAIMTVCITLMVLGFFVTALPVAVRLVFLGIAAVLPPVAAITGNRAPW